MERIGEGQLSFLRDVLRKQILGNIVITGKPRAREQSKKTMIKPHENLSQLLHVCEVEITQRTRDREECRTMIANVRT